MNRFKLDAETDELTMTVGRKAYVAHVLELLKESNWDESSWSIPETVEQDDVIAELFTPSNVTGVGAFPDGDGIEFDGHFTVREAIDYDRGDRWNPPAVSYGETRGAFLIRYDFSGLGEFEVGVEVESNHRYPEDRY